VKLFSQRLIHLLPTHGLSLITLGMLRSAQTQAAKATRLESANLNEESRNLISKGLKLVPGYISGWLCLSQLTLENLSHQTAVECVKNGLKAIEKRMVESGGASFSRFFSFFFFSYFLSSLALTGE
jgi:hypothetical protein